MAPASLKRASPKKSRRRKEPQIVVGIGASAGSFRALQSLLAGFAGHEELTMVIAEHLDSNGNSLAIESIDRLSPLKAVGLTEGARLETGFVYIVPPHSFVTIDNGRARLAPARKAPEKLTVIDHLFAALAKEYGDRAVGVILSGEGSDGAQGVRDINEAGGLALAQEPGVAERPSMPEAALATGAVDHALNVEELIAEIKSHAAYMASHADVGDRSAIKNEIAAAVVDVCESLVQRTKHDFKHYKTTTLVRRIHRRMQVLQIATVAEYLDLLKAPGDECERLFKELLINVTGFFRDAEAFEALRDQVLAPLVEDRRSGRKIRIWVAGCSTGEEAYTIAILMRELTEDLPDPPETQIIATDIDDSALNAARKGAFSSSIVEQMTPARLRKNFVKRGGKYHVAKELREMCLFSIHNLITDPPFSQLDLVSCRNVMIYLGPHLQKKLFPVFHYSLRSGGHLFLGNSETLAAHKELFRAIDVKHRIAQRKPTAIKLPSINTLVQNYLSNFQHGEKASETDLALIGQRIALDEMPLRYVIVNDELQILSASGGVNKYLEFSEGAFQNSVIKLVAASLRPALRAAFHQAKKEKRKIVNDSCTLKSDKGMERTAVIVQPMPRLGDMSELYWIAFQSLGSIQQKEMNAAPDEQAAIADYELVEQLERELSVARAELDKSVQDLEASNEELKSSNEELLSMNEELQSANEELETSKEEVQNANEALQGINSDLENLLASTEIATLFLDESGRIRNFTQQLSSIYNIVRGDVDRPIAHITSRARAMPPMPTLENLRRAGLLEDEIEIDDGRRLIRRVTPYRSAEGDESGLVITFIDISKLRATQERFRLLTEMIPQLVWSGPSNGARDFLSGRWMSYTGASESELLGFGWLDGYVHPDDRARVRALWAEAARGLQEFAIEYRIRRADGVYRWFQAREVPSPNANGGGAHWFGACTDIHDLKESQVASRENETRFRQLANSIPQLAWMARPDGFIYWYNERWYEYTGLKPGEGEGWGWDQVHDPEMLPLVTERWRRSLASGEPFEMSFPLRAANGEYRWFLTRIAPIRNSFGDVVHWFGTNTDVTVHRNAQMAMERAKDAIEIERKNFRNLFSQTPELACILIGPDHRFDFVNEAHVKVLGFNATGQTVREAQPESVEIHHILDRVYRTGETAHLHEIPITVGDRLRHFNLTYAAYFGLNEEVIGIIILGIEITEQVESRRALERVADLIERMPTAFFAVDREWKLTFWNPASEKTIGYQKAQMLGRSLWEAFPGLEDSPFGNAYKQCLTESRKTSVEAHFPGLGRWFEATAFPFQGGVAVGFSDVSDRKRSEERLEASRRQTEDALAQLAAKSAQLETIVEHMPISVMLAEAPSGRLIFANNQFEKIWGFPMIPADSVEDYGKYVGYHPDGRRYEGRDWPLARSIVHGEVVLSEETIVEIGGGRRAVFSLSSAPVRDVDGKIVAGVVLTEDMTERRASMLEVRQAKEEAERANEAKTRFLANMSHEIRTPLSAIIGFTDLLLARADADAEIRAFIERVHRNSGQLSRLIDELLDLSKIEAGRLEVQAEAVNVNAFVEDLRSMMALRAEEKGLRLEFSWSSPQPTTIHTDPLRLSQILINVVGNAVKFTERGGVAVEFNASPERFVARVTDTGIGLSAEEQAKIFEPFVQADPSIARRYGGTGLGLALSKRLARLLNGDLKLERSAKGEGTAFVVDTATFPPREDRAVDAGETSSPPSDALAGRIILVVDDSPDNRAIVSRYLRGVGAEVREASNGDEGARMATTQAFDLVFMDIQMPIVDGYQAIARLKAEGYRIPVVALTAHAFKEERDRCLRSGFANYLTKPINRERLQRVAVQMILGHAATSRDS